MFLLGVGGGGGGGGGGLVFVTRGMRKKFLFKCMPFAGVEENCFEGFLGKLQVFH